LLVGGATNNLNLSFGKVLKARRLGCGLTQAQLATESLLHVNHISRLEKGLAEPTLEDLFQLATAMHIDTGEFLGDMITLQIKLMTKVS